MPRRLASTAAERSESEALRRGAPLTKKEEKKLHARTKNKRKMKSMR